MSIHRVSFIGRFNTPFNFVVSNYDVQIYLDETLSRIEKSMICIQVTPEGCVHLNYWDVSKPFWDGYAQNLETYAILQYAIHFSKQLNNSFNAVANIVLFVLYGICNRPMHVRMYTYLHSFVGSVADMVSIDGNFRDYYH